MYSLFCPVCLSPWPTADFHCIPRASSPPFLPPFLPLSARARVCRTLTLLGTGYSSFSYLSTTIQKGTIAEPSLQPAF
ncbi:uncharacterized protein BO95DRAFT_92694 [Aspergillus brunneoviolaceus CBS 621.78]|uniref:Uncharacterized protein n=1 Tax=Aspergillus brunneoviolaceus CBS 621.78 TaxID=1450534 RepID=A0ACD1GCF3_9EURO|nr:hypothetical protein BO95DRAFT_92694 [Aspergillus brunneoviolaceus CBS 621.78]RAH46944.1 hypothetical protein BO95DRAFT_92694 [Aspergillus brunneoviolaceus CBS 621.78]